VWLREFVEHDNRIQFIKERLNASWGTIILWALGILIVAIISYRLATVVPIQ